MSEQIIALRAIELEALHGTGPLAMAIYLHLRAWMDFGTGIAGRSRPLSLAMLAAYTETHITRGAGIQIAQESEKTIRVAIDRLTRCGLLRRPGGERLCFLLPLALTASVRRNQTGRDEGTVSSTEQGTVEAAPEQGEDGEHGPVHAMLQWPNWAHIRFHENLKPTAPHVDNFAPANGSHSTRQNSLAAGTGAGSTNQANANRLLMLGERIGRPPRPGETWRDYRSRLFQIRPTHSQGTTA